MSALELHQPSGSGQHAYLAIPVKGKEPLTVRLNPSWVALLRVLEGEYRKDVARPQAARGWRSYLEVGKQMGNVPDQDPIEATTARAYVYRLRRTIERAASRTSRNSSKAAAATEFAWGSRCSSWSSLLQ